MILRIIKLMMIIMKTKIKATTKLSCCKFFYEIISQSTDRLNLRNRAARSPEYTLFLLSLLIFGRDAESSFQLIPGEKGLR